MKTKELHKILYTLSINYNDGGYMAFHGALKEGAQKNGTKPLILFQAYLGTDPNLIDDDELEKIAMDASKAGHTGYVDPIINHIYQNKRSKFDKFITHVIESADKGFRRAETEGIKSMFRFRLSSLMSNYAQNVAHDINEWSIHIMAEYGHSDILFKMLSNVSKDDDEYQLYCESAIQGAFSGNQKNLLSQILEKIKPNDYLCSLPSNVAKLGNRKMLAMLIDHCKNVFDTADDCYLDFIIDLDISDIVNDDDSDQKYLLKYLTHYSSEVIQALCTKWHSEKQKDLRATFEKAKDIAKRMDENENLTFDDALLGKKSTESQLERLIRDASMFASPKRTINETDNPNKDDPKEFKRSKR